MAENIQVDIDLELKGKAIVERQVQEVFSKLKKEYETKVTVNTKDVEKALDRIEYRIKRLDDLRQNADEITVAQERLLITNAKALEQLKSQTQAQLRMMKRGAKEVETGGESRNPYGGVIKNLERTQMETKKTVTELAILDKKLGQEHSNKALDLNNLNKQIAALNKIKTELGNAVKNAEKGSKNITAAQFKDLQMQYKNAILAHEAYLAQKERLELASNARIAGANKHIYGGAQFNPLVDLKNRYAGGIDGMDRRQVKNDLRAMQVLKSYIKDDHLNALGIDPVTFKTELAQVMAGMRGSGFATANPNGVAGGRGGWWNQLMGKLGGRWHPYGRGDDGTFNQLNKRLTNISQLAGFSLYGMGTIGAGVGLTRASIGAAMEADQNKTVMSGLINTYKQFVDVTGKAVDAQQNYNISVLESQRTYDMVRKQAVTSILTTKEMFNFYLTGAPAMMNAGLSTKQSLQVVDKFAQVGRAMGLIERDIIQDIRSLAQGPITGANKTAQVLGINTVDRDKALQGGGDAFMKYINAKTKGIQPALDAFANSFTAQWSNLIDRIQQIGIRLGEAVIPIFLGNNGIFSKIEKILGDWESSGRLASLADSIGAKMIALTDVFTFFLDKTSFMFGSLEGIIATGIGAIIAKAVVEVSIQNGFLSTATGRFVGILGLLVAGIVMANKQAEAAAYGQRTSTANFGATEAGLSQKEREARRNSAALSMYDMSPEERLNFGLSQSEIGVAKNRSQAVKSSQRYIKARDVLYNKLLNSGKTKEEASKMLRLMESDTMDRSWGGKWGGSIQSVMTLDPALPDARNFADSTNEGREFYAAMREMNSAVPTMETMYQLNKASSGGVVTKAAIQADLNDLTKRLEKKYFPWGVPNSLDKNKRQAALRANPAFMKEYTLESERIIAKYGKRPISITNIDTPKVGKSGAMPTLSQITPDVTSEIMALSGAKMDVSTKQSYLSYLGEALSGPYATPQSNLATIMSMRKARTNLFKTQMNEAGMQRNYGLAKLDNDLEAIFTNPNGTPMNAAQRKVVARKMQSRINELNNSRANINVSYAQSVQGYQESYNADMRRYGKDSEGYSATFLAEAISDMQARSSPVRAIQAERTLLWMKSRTGSGLTPTEKRRLAELDRQYSDYLGSERTKKSATYMEGVNRNFTNSMNLVGLSGMDYTLAQRGQLIEGMTSYAGGLGEGNTGGPLGNLGAALRGAILALRSNTMALEKKTAMDMALGQIKFDSYMQGQTYTAGGMSASANRDQSYSRELAIASAKIDGSNMDAPQKQAAKQFMQAQLFRKHYGTVKQQEMRSYQDQMLSGGQAAMAAIMSGQDPIKAFAGQYSNGRMNSNLNLILSKSSSKSMRGVAATELAGTLAAGMIVNSMGGYAQEGSMIGGMLAQAGVFGASLGPLGIPAAMIGGGLLGSLFGKSRRDPQVEAHRRKLEDLLSRIDKSLRPVGDYFRVIRGEAAWGSASGYYGNRVNNPLGGQASLGGSM